MPPPATQQCAAPVLGARFAVREWLSYTSRAPERPSMGTMVAVLVCSVYQSLLVAMLLFRPGGNAAEITQSITGAVIVGAGGISAAVVLAWAPRFPLSVLILECAALVAAALVSLQDAVLFPVLFAVFAATSRLRAAKLALAGAAVLLATTVSAALFSSPGTFLAEYLGLLSVVLAAAAVGIAARSLRGWQRSQRQALIDTQHAESLSRQRDLAETRSQIAAELHDSVGHKLTSIIALSEGLIEITADAETEEALQGINAVARESLAETRQAVRALAESADRAGMSWQGDPLPGSGDLDAWEQAAALVEQSRSLGLSVLFVEAGERAADPGLAHLCFTITREALTNAMRHSVAPREVAVTWKHLPEELVVVVRNTSTGSSNADQPGAAPGTGLLLLRSRVEASGGTLTYGWAETATWEMRASVPAMHRTASRTDEVAARSLVVRPGKRARL